MCFSATIVRPLRSKRARISPVRRRSKASGFTRIRVRSISAPLSRVSGQPAEGGRSRPARAWRSAAAWRSAVAWPSGCRAARGVAARGPAERGCPAALPCAAGAAGGLGRRLAHLGLAVGADLPARVERLAADGAGLLEPAQAARAAQERLLHLEAAVLAAEVLDAGQPRLGRGDLELALAHVVEVLGRAHDQVDDRPDEREQRRGGGAGHQQRVGDPPAGVGVGPVDQREPDHHQEQDQQVDREVQPVVLDAEDGEGTHGGAECSRRGPYRKSRPSSVADPEEHQDHGGHHDGHQADHRAETRSVAVHERVNRGRSRRRVRARRDGGRGPLSMGRLGPRGARPDRPPARHVLRRRRPVLPASTGELKGVRQTLSRGRRSRCIGRARRDRVCRALLRPCWLHRVGDRSFTRPRSRRVERS